MLNHVSKRGHLSLNELMMETFFALLALCESQRPVTRSFDVFFELRLNKQWSKQSRRRWFEAPSRSLWHHSNTSAVLIYCGLDLGELEWNLNQITKNFAREKWNLTPSPVNCDHYVQVFMHEEKPFWFLLYTFCQIYLSACQCFTQSVS